METIPQVSVPHFDPNISVQDIKAIDTAMRAKTIDFVPLINMLLGLWWQPHLPYLHHPLMSSLLALFQLRHQDPMPLLALTDPTHLIRHQFYPLSHESYRSIK